MAELDLNIPEPGDPVYEIHHAEGAVKGVDFGDVTSIDVPGVCIPGTDIEMGVSIVASGGASGSPIFNANSHCVVGICHCGPPCSPGWGIPIGSIMADALPAMRARGEAFNPIFCGEERASGFCPGDVTGDFKVDVEDLNHILNWWGVNRDYADANGDGRVDFADLDMLLDNFGRNCLGFD